MSFNKNLYNSVQNWSFRRDKSTGKLFLSEWFPSLTNVKSCGSNALGGKRSDGCCGFSNNVYEIKSVIIMDGIIYCTSVDDMRVKCLWSRHVLPKKQYSVHQCNTFEGEIGVIRKSNANIVE